MKRRAERNFTSKLYKNYVFTRNLTFKYEKRIQNINWRSFSYRTTLRDSIHDGVYLGRIIPLTFWIGYILDDTVQVW